MGGAKRGTYQASKHGVLGLEKKRGNRLRSERHSDQCRLSGPYSTPPMAEQMMAAGQTDALNAMLKEVPIGRLGRPEEIAGAVLWLCSDAATLMVGHALVVDGGYTIR